MSDVWPQQVGAGNVVTTAFVQGAGNWARRWGRQQPMKGTAATRIIAEVRENVYSEDANGLAYGADTLWVRCFAAPSTGSLNEDELDQLNWMGVPATLPGGYTVRNNRNIGPACDWGCGAGSTVQTNGDIAFPTVSPFYPAPGSPTNFVRSAGGLHVPRANDGLQKWGPWNAGNQYVEQSATNTGPPDFFPYDHGRLCVPPSGGVLAGATSKTATDVFTVLSSYQWACPGYRSVGVFFYVTRQWYDGVPGTVPVFSSSTLTITLGGASLTMTASKADLSPSPGGPPDFNQKDFGNVGSLLANVGDSPFLYGTMTTNFSAAPIATSLNGSGAWILVFAPRVDIPLPFTATGPGNLVAPGGILTGSIPGW